MASIGTASRENFVHIFQARILDRTCYAKADLFKMIVPGSILYVTSLWAIKVALVCVITGSNCAAKIAHVQGDLLQAHCCTNVITEGV